MMSAMRGLPREILSEILEYFPDRHAPLRSIPFGNPTLKSAALVNTLWASLARPKLWSYIVLPDRSLVKAELLLEIVSTSPDIKYWIHHLVSRDWATENRLVATVTNILLQLPAVKRLVLRAPVRWSNSAHGDEPIVYGWTDWPLSWRQAFQKCIFPLLTHLTVKELHYLPYEEILPHCICLESLDIKMESSARFDPLPMSQNTLPLVKTPARLTKLSLHGPACFKLLDVTSGCSPVPFLQTYELNLIHFTLDAFIRDMSPGAWASLVTSFGATLRVFTFGCPQHAIIYTHLDLTNFPKLETLKIRFYWRNSSHDHWFHEHMDELSRLLSTSIAIQDLHLHLEDSSSKQTPKPLWSNLDSVLRQKGIVTVVSCSWSRRWKTRGTSKDCDENGEVSNESSSEDEAKDRVDPRVKSMIARALPLIASSGQLVYVKGVVWLQYVSTI